MATAPSPDGFGEAAADIAPQRARPAATVLLLVLGDLLAAGLSGVIALWLRHLFIGSLSYGTYLRLAPALLLFPLSYAHAGLYPGYGVGPVDQLRRIFRYSTLVALLVLSSSFFFKNSGEFSRVVLLVSWLLMLLLVPLMRGLLRALLARTAWWGEPLLILGAARTGEVVARKLLGNPGLGLRPVACLDDDPAKHGQLCGGIPVVGPLSLAPRLAAAHRLRSVVVAMPGLRRQRMLQVVEEHAGAFPKVRIIPDLLGVTSLWVSARDLQGVLGLELHQNLLSGWSRFLKRMMDLAVSVPLLVLAGPVILLAGLAVKLNSPGPAFYFQEREGLHGRRIRVWKIRTMVPDAEVVLQEYLARNPAAKREWAQYLKLRDDPRIVPRVGHLFRRFSLDELPQLWNIVKGEMSLVGPRPFPDYHLSRFPAAFRSLRRRVPPGLTGLWQVSARSDGDLAIQEELDTYYIRNWSLWLDIYLLSRTVTAVLFGKGAY